MNLETMISALVLVVGGVCIAVILFVLELISAKVGVGGSLMNLFNYKVIEEEEGDLRDEEARRQTIRDVERRVQDLCKEVLFLRNEYKGRRWEAEDVDAWKETRTNIVNNHLESDYPRVALRQMRSTRRRAGRSGNQAGRRTSDFSLNEENLL